MKAQDVITLVEVEFMGFAVLDKCVELDRLAIVTAGPVMYTGKEVFAYAFGAQIGFDNDVVDLQLFSRIDADRYPAIGHGDQFAILPKAEAMVGGEGKHVGQAGAYLFRLHVGMQFISERYDGIAVPEGQFAKFQRVVVLDSLAVGHGFVFSRFSPEKSKIQN